MMLKRSPFKTALDFYWLSASYAGNGEKEKGLAALQKAFEQGFRDFAAIGANPAFESVRGDARFQEMVKKYGK